MEAVGGMDEEGGDTDAGEEVGKTGGDGVGSAGSGDEDVTLALMKQVDDFNKRIV